MHHIIDEGESLPNQVVEIILAQFIRKQPPKEKKKDQTELTSLGIGGYPAAYTMAKGICQDCADHLSRDVCTYFSEVLLPDSTDEEIDIEDLQKAHYIINELYLASPHILSNTIPLLEAELQIENINHGAPCPAQRNQYIICENCILTVFNNRNNSTLIDFLRGIAYNISL